MTSVNKFYFHDAASSDSGIMPTTTQSATSPGVTQATATTNRSMDGLIGLSQSSPAMTSLATVSKQNNFFRKFASYPLAAQNIPVGAWAMRIAIKAGNAVTSPWQISAIVYIWRPSNGTKVITIVDAVTTGIGTAATTSETDTTQAQITASGSAATVLSGDILIVEVWGTVTQTAANGIVWTLSYGGTVEGSITSNASYLLAPVFITILDASRNRTLMGVGL